MGIFILKLTNKGKEELIDYRFKSNSVSPSCLAFNTIYLLDE